MAMKIDTSHYFAKDPSLKHLLINASDFLNNSISNFRFSMTSIRADVLKLNESTEKKVPMKDCLQDKYVLHFHLIHWLKLHCLSFQVAFYSYIHNFYYF